MENDVGPINDVLTIFGSPDGVFYPILSTFEVSIKTMRLPSFFKQQRNKTYNYKPRYYDERKERMDKLRKQKEAERDTDYFKEYRKKSFREDWKTVKSMDRNKNSRLRFIIILILLFMFAYAAIKYGKIDFLY